MFPSSYFAPTYFAPKYYPPITEVIVNIIRQVFCLTGAEESNSITAQQAAVSLTQSLSLYTLMGIKELYTLSGIKSIYSLQGIEEAFAILAADIEPISIILNQSSYDIVGEELAPSSIGAKDAFNVIAQETGASIVATIKIVC